MLTPRDQLPTDHLVFPICDEALQLTGYQIPLELRVIFIQLSNYSNLQITTFQFLVFKMAVKFENINLHSDPNGPLLPHLR